MSTGITFDSNSLQTSSIMTAEINHSSVDYKEQAVYAMAHANRSVISHEEFSKRSITISGKIISTSISGLDTLLDTFRGYFRTKDANLDIDYAGSTRRYIATMSGISIDRPGGLLFASFTVSFICSEPFGRDTSATTAVTGTGRTANSYSDNYTFLGTGPYQLPIITYTVNSITDGNSYLSFSNVANGQGILITDHTFTAGEVLVIDCLNKTVTVDGLNIDYAGAFPEFAPGAQTIAYGDGFTARDFDLSITYYKMYL